MTLPLTLWKTIMATDSQQSTPALRISQLDAKELDGELINLLKSQLTKSFKYHKTKYLSLLEPEINAALRLFLWKFSSYASGASVGQQLLGLKYRDVNSNQWMTRTQKVLLATILIGCPWLQERLGVILSLIGAQQFTGKVSSAINRLELAGKIGSTVNFLVFLQNGRYLSLTERILGIRSYFPEKQTIRQVSFDFMTRELLWHGFSEFLFFVLPLINYQRLTNLVRRYTLAQDSRGKTDRTEADLKQCAVCGDWPMNPQEIGCNHIFCYYCVQSNYKADVNFACVICGQTIPSVGDIKPVQTYLDISR